MGFLPSLKARTSPRITVTRTCALVATNYSKSAAIRARGNEPRVIPNDLLTAVKDIKLAILQSRARAAQSTNIEALKLYLYVGGYVSRKTRKVKWGMGAIDALSSRLQVELPGLRGFSPSSIKRMRSLFEEWNKVMDFRPSAMGESEDGAFELKMGKFRSNYLGQLSAYLSALDKIEKKPDENPSVGILLCEKMNKPFVQLAVQDFSKPIGIATYQTLRAIPKPYRELAPVIEGVRKALMETPKASGSTGH
ncbi:MAG: DUF1016 family protein [bacterium]|nr:DUF1016 family protein [Candidatus Colisoma equi]